MQPEVLTTKSRESVFLPDWADRAIDALSSHSAWIGLSRVEKLEVLQLFFLRNLVEDGQDGTNFDCDIMDTIEALQTKYRGDG